MRTNSFKTQGQDPTKPAFCFVGAIIVYGLSSAIFPQCVSDDLSVHKMADIDVAVYECKGSLSVELVIHKMADIDVAVCVCKGSLSVDIIVHKMADIDVAVCECKGSLAVVAE